MSEPDATQQTPQNPPPTAPGAEPEVTPATDAAPAATTPSDPKPAETVEFWKTKAREQEARAKSNAAAAIKLKEIEDRDLSELQKAQRDRDIHATKLAEYERTTIRQRIALEKGVPASLVNRLQGATEDEVSADADALLALLKSPTAPRPDPSQGAQPTSAEALATAEYERYYPSTRK